MSFAKSSHHGKSDAAYPVVIIGAGFGGIAMACQLKRKLGLRPDQFHIFERQSAVGGTWWINKYPGIACDIPANFYSLSFFQNPNWSAFYPSGPEIFAYANKAVDKFGLRPSLSLDHEILQCQWDEGSEHWILTVAVLAPGCGDFSTAQRQDRINKEGRSSVYLSEMRVTCKILVSAVGGLVEPAPWPASVPGKDAFHGAIIHSARWDKSVDFHEKDVVVVGTGCSAAQLVPKLLTEEYGARSVTQLMREPPWVIPQFELPPGNKWWADWWPTLSNYLPGFMGFMRALTAVVMEADFRLFGISQFGAWERKKLQHKLLAHIKTTAPKKYHDMLSPQYSIGCKRRIYDTEWFPSMHDSRYELTTLALAEVREDQVTLRPGTKTHSSEQHLGERTLHADIIVLANGFAVHDWFHPLKVIGRGGRQMQEVFDARGGPQLYRGTALDGFPNLFVLFGPNSFTGHSSVILGLENQVNHAIKLMKPVVYGDAGTIEIKKIPTIQYNQQVQRDLKKMVWNSGGCSNWYTNEEGKNSVSYPYSMTWQTIRFMFPTWSDWTITWSRKGLRKRRTTAILRAFLLLGAVLVLYQGRKGNLQGYTNGFRSVLDGLLSKLKGV